MAERMMSFKMDSDELEMLLDEIPHVTSLPNYHHDDCQDGLERKDGHRDEKLVGVDDHIWSLSSSGCSSTSLVSHNGVLSLDGSERPSSPSTSDDCLPLFRRQTMGGGANQIESWLTGKGSPPITNPGGTRCKEQLHMLFYAFEELGIREFSDEAADKNKLDASNVSFHRLWNSSVVCDEVMSLRLQNGDNTSIGGSDYYSRRMGYPVQSRLNAEDGIDGANINYNWGGSPSFGRSGCLNNLGEAGRVFLARREGRSLYASQTLGMAMPCSQIPFSFGDHLQYGNVPAACGFGRNSVMHNNENLQQSVPTVWASSHHLSMMRNAQILDVFGEKKEGILNDKYMQRNHFHGWGSILHNGNNKANAYMNLNYLGSSVDETFQLGAVSPRSGCVSWSFSHNSASSPPSKYNSVWEIQGRISGVAKDQQGCRYLQRVLELGSPQEVIMIFSEVIGHTAELMKDPFGNYLMQKMLDVCTERQRTQIICAITAKPKELANISLDVHGTRVVQKLIETLKEPYEICMIISSLEPWAVNLMTDLNGNHVIQSCLRSLSIEDNKFLFDASAKHCVEIATHQHGCCVLQRCLDYSTGRYRQSLVAEISANAIILSQDAFGNYIVQYVLDNIQWAREGIVCQLQGNYVDLSMQKYGSNVVEKCLKLGEEYVHSIIILELVSSSSFEQLLQDPFANYVIQSALKESKGALRSVLVEAIQPFSSVLRSNPYGKRIVSQIQSKK